jgi:hypothetical protein
MDYGDAVVTTSIYLDTFHFSGLTVKNMPFGDACKMEGFNYGFDGYLGLGRNVNLNTNETQYAKRDIPASGFVPNAYQQSSGLQSAQFGMYTTSVGSGYSDSGSVASSVSTSSPANNNNNEFSGSSNSANTGTPPNTGSTNNGFVPSSPSANSGVTSGGSGVTSGGFGRVKRGENCGEEPAGYLIIGKILSLFLFYFVWFRCYPYLLPLLP